VGDSERAALASQDAQSTREELWSILRQYPPSLGEVLQRDPSLLDRPDYLSPYPVLVAFLERHPEIRRSPAFYLGGFSFQRLSREDRALEMFESMAVGAALLTGFCVFAAMVVWAIRTVVDHRRWLRQSRVQVEVHNKILDRLSSNEDLLTYAKTPAGSRFLESAPIELGGPAAATPLGRIIWSVQAGVVLMSLGVGLWVAQGSLLEEVQQGFKLIGTVAVSLGLGFVASAAVAFLVSSRVGLLPGRES
jgi:hypothetical protein